MTMSDALRWFRVKPSYRKPAGGFLAIGPRYPGELVDDGNTVRFHQHGAPEWVEIVPIEHVEAVEKDPPPRRRWK
jgi:hypothetical protein